MAKGLKEQIVSYFSGDYVAFYEKYLPEVKHLGGEEHSALCPFHDDAKPSFNFNATKGTYYCHGCDKKGDIFHFYARLHSLDTRRDFAKVLKGIATDFGIPTNGNGRKPKVVKTYDYVDERGHLLFQVCRMEPKDFRQRRPDGKGGWIWNLKGIKPVLYHLPEVIKANEILIVEGEKDVETARKLGFAATTCPMGAGKWRDEYSDHLKDKDVVLIPDNDQKGREHMTKVAQSLVGKAKSLKWIDLPRVPSKGDLSDWVANYDDLVEAGERLALMIENAETYNPPKSVSLEDVILPSSDFLKVEMPEKKAFLAPWLKESSINMIAGWRGTGKTFLTLGIFGSVAQGKNFGPWKCEIATTCLFLDGEMDPRDIQERITSLKIESENLLIYSDALANRYGLPRANLANPKWREKMKAILISHKVKLWAVDNIASLASGLDENKKSDWDPINSWLLDLRFCGIATILLHHVGKEGDQRGTSAREDNLDTSIVLKSPPTYAAEDGCRFVLRFKKARVPTSEVSLISDTEFRLVETQDGSYVWTFGNVRRQTRDEILRLLDEGHTQAEIKDILDIDKAYVSRVRKRAIHEGLLTENNKLTQSGFKAVREI